MAIISTFNLLVLPVLCFVLYHVGLIIYRLYFHSLAKFPGPKIAAATLWHDFYYDCFKRGTLIFRIGELHKHYGPIIRLAPNELHIQDSEYYDEIYTSAPRRRDKWLWWTRLSSSPGSMFATVAHDHHRLRRSVLNPFFSKRSIVNLEPLIRSKLAKLRARFAKAAETGESIRLDVAFMALTTDIISDYAFGPESDPKYLEVDDFGVMWKETILGGFESAAQSRQMPWMAPAVMALPFSFLVKILPQIAYFLRWQATVRVNVDRVVNQTDAEKAEFEATGQRKTMFHAIRDSDLPAEEKTADRLMDEGVVLMGAASETTAHTLSSLSFYLLNQPGQVALKKIRAEIQAASPSDGAGGDIPYATLENLPYLSAVILEGLRLGYGVTTRLPRVAPNEDLVYKGWTIPRGTPVSSTSYFVLTDPAIFPEPDVFRPERWIVDYDDEKSYTEGGGPMKKNFKLDKYMVAFGKGSRQCLGMNLAYAEMYLTLPMLATEIFGKETMGFELFETEWAKDVALSHDFFTAVPSLDSKGVRVRVG